MPIRPLRPPLESAERRRHAWTAAIVASASAMTIDRVATIEWSFPYCNDPQDGLAPAVFGAPLPYERWNGVSSMEYKFAPHLYALNIVLVSIVLYAIFRRAMARLGPGGRLGHRLLRSGGALLLVANLTWACIALTGRIWRPVQNITNPSYDSYAELRPVGLTMSRHYECSPSRFWFGPVRRRDAVTPAGN